MPQYGPSEVAGMPDPSLLVQLRGMRDRGQSLPDNPLLNNLVTPLGAPAVNALAASGVTISPRGVPLSGHAYYPMDAVRTNLTAAPIDASGNARNMALGAAITAAECNVNAGYMTTKAVANGHINTTFQANWSTDMFVMAFTINMPTPAGLVFFAGSNDYVTTETGLSFGVGSDAKLRVFVAGSDSGTGNITGGSGLAYIAGSTVVVADGTDHKVGVAYDYKRRALYVWIDGVLVLSKQNALASGSGAWTRPFVWGTNKGGSGTTQTIKLKHVNIYSKIGGVLPANINTVMSSYATTPQNIWPLFDQNTRDVSLFTAGQSNQMGYGGTGDAINTGVGAPIKDPLYPNGVSTKRSMYPACAKVLGALGYKLNVHNYAVGSSGLFDNWVGGIRDWVLNGLVKQGTFLANGGRVYKATLSTGINGLSNATVAPTNGGVDGNITWTDVGADTGFRGAASSGSPYFDPNGYIAALVTSLTASDSPRKFVYVAFGETDANMAVTRAQYSDALVSFTNAVLNAGAHRVGIGHTFGTAAWLNQYNNNLVPGLQDALTAFSGDSRVFASLNAYASLGALATAPASGVGFLADAIHGNDAAYDLAGAQLGDNLLAQLMVMA